MRERKGEMGERRVKDERYFVKILPSIRSRLSNRDLYPDVTERASGEALLAFCKNNETEKKRVKEIRRKEKKEGSITMIKKLNDERVLDERRLAPVKDVGG